MSSLDSKVLDQHATTYSDRTSGRVSHWREFKDSFRRMEPVAVSGEGLEAANQKTANTNLQSSIKPVHQIFISLGSCIGSGLLVVSGKALASGGPAAVLIAWGLVSSFLYCVMEALGELVSIFPVSGSFALFATRFIDPSFGFAAGWNYAMFWVVVLPLELVASSLTINFWHSDINLVVWVAVFFVLIIFLNLVCGTQGFANTELVALVIKLMGIIGFDILAIVLICGGGNEGYIGTKNWHHPGAFAHGFKGVVTVLISATYSLAGTELVGLTAAESAGNPRLVLPRAIKQVFYRIVVFYMFTLTLIGFLVPYDSPNIIGTSNGASASPFVIAIKAGGIKALPSIFNVVVLVSLLSIGNLAVYGFSRTILSLAEQGLAPGIFEYVDRRGRPLVGIAVLAIVGLLAFVSASPKQGEVFLWLVALLALSTLFTWAACTMAHIRFRAGMKAQGRSLDELPYRAKTGVWGLYYATICLFVVLCLQFWISLFPLGAPPDAVVFFENYLGAVIVFVLYFCHKVYLKKWNTVVPLDTMDLDTGRRETDVEKLQQELAEERELLRARPWYIKMYYFLF